MPLTSEQEAERVASNLRQEKLQVLYLALDIVTKTQSPYPSVDLVFTVYDKIKKETGI